MVHITCKSMGRVFGVVRRQREKWKQLSLPMPRCGQLANITLTQRTRYIGAMLV